MNDDEQYSTSVEFLIDDWKDKCIKESDLHNILSKYKNKKYYCFGLIQIALPILMTLATQLIKDEESNRIVSSVGFMLVGVTTVVLNFFNFKVISERHKHASVSYKNLVNDIESIMSSPHRINSDVLISKINNEIKNLNIYSPSTDGSCISDSCFKT